MKTKRTTIKEHTNNRTSKLIPTVAVIFTVIVWGMSFVSSKTILNTGVPPMTMILLRFLLASLILLILHKKFEPTVKMTKRDFISLALSGLFGVTLYFFFESYGIKHTSASSASLIIATIPIFTVIADTAIYKTKISFLKVLGICISIVGVYFIIKAPNTNTVGNSSNIKGNVLMLGACISWVIYIIVSKKLREKISALTLTTYQSLFGTLFILPLSLLEYKSWVTVNITAWLNIAYLAIFCTAIAFFLFMYSVSKLGVVLTSTYTNLVPVVSVAGGVVLLGEHITPIKLIGGLIVIAGIYIVNHKSSVTSHSELD